jgi:Domain of unknown function (DUF1877)
MNGEYLRVSPSVIRDIQAEPSMLLYVLYPDPEPDGFKSRRLDIEKTWHIIHFLLNGDASDGSGPLFCAVLGGSQLTSDDLGYGSARFLDPTEVVATAKALSSISPEELWSRFDEARVRKAELYWSTEPEGKGYALENYKALRSFFTVAAETGDAVILWLA